MKKTNDGTVSGSRLEVGIMETMARMEFAERQMADVAQRDGWKVLGRFTSPTGIPMVRVEYPKGYNTHGYGKAHDFQATVYDNAQVARADEVWMNPTDFGTNGLHYRAAWGKHIVTHTMHAGEDLAPDVYTFKTVEEARKMWLKLRAVLAERGYTERAPF